MCVCLMLIWCALLTCTIIGSLGGSTRLEGFRANDSRNTTSPTYHIHTNRHTPKILVETKVEVRRYAVVL